MAVFRPGYRAKFERGKEQFAELHKHIATEVANCYESVFEPDIKRGTHRLRMIKRKDPPAMDWALEVGDILHNLRGSLDHLAYALAGPSAGGHTQFPITDSPGAWQAATTPPKKPDRHERTFGMDPQAIKRIHEMQPYVRPKDNRAFGWLRELSDWDKHRLPHLTVIHAAISRSNVLTKITRTASTPGTAAEMTGDMTVIGRTSGPFEDDTPLAEDRA